MPKPFSFAKQKRLLDSKAFKVVFNHQKKSVFPIAVVYTKPNDLGFPRLGVVVSKRVSKRAVARNRLKRLTRESFRLHQHMLLSHDYVVVVRPCMVELSNHQIDQRMEQVWTKTIKRFSHR